jgi:DNA modification methylase
MEIKSTAEQIILTGNNIDSLKKYPDNFFDSIVTDPPYGLGKEPNAEEMLRAWITEGYLEVKGTGFMGKEWDAFVPQPIFWKEVFRVLKHGGHVVSFFGTRTYDWGVMSMRLAGFEVRDCIQWIYGSGFPKSHNISKAIDKMYGAEREVVGQGKAGKGFNKVKGFGTNTTKSDEFTSEWDVTEASTDQAKEWDGWGSALKPANEPIVLARKPLEKGLSIAENVLKWGTGAINIDVSRINHNEEQKFTNREQRKEGWNMDNCGFDSTNNHTASADPSGRFPSNVILTHHPQCECLGLKKVKGSSCLPSDIGKGKTEKSTNGIYGEKVNKITVSHNDENGEETIENWNCHDDCPIKVLDEQSGISSSSDTQRTRNTLGSFGMPNNATPEYSDTGGASRFFYVAKASKSERNFGLDEFEEKQTVGGGGLTAELREDGSLETASAGGKYGSIKALQTNVHPTVKPVKLMQYLVRMITPPNGTVLDPFAGSGTTGVACKIDGFNFVGLELSEEYAQIGRARIEKFVEEKEFIDDCKIFESEKNKIESQYRLFD